MAVSALLWSVLFGACDNTRSIFHPNSGCCSDGVKVVSPAFKLTC